MSKRKYTPSIIMTHYRKDGKAKRGYRTLAQANKAIKGSKVVFGRDMRAYLCDFCGRFHLATASSQSSKDG